MTIATDTARTGPYTGNGSTTVFAYGFKVIDEAHLVVTLTVIATGVETVQTLTTHYTVSGVGAEGGGNVTMVTFPAATETLTISRAVTQSQPIDLLNRGSVQPETLETALDRNVQMVQDFDEAVSRTPKFVVSADLSSFDTGIPAPVASKAVAINAAGTGFDLVDTPAIAAASATASAAAALVSENAAASSETNAASSETNSSGSEAVALLWATEVEDTLVSGAGYSALHHSAKAAAAAAAALAAKITISTSSPSGGSDGDIWFKTTT